MKQHSCDPPEDGRLAIPEFSVDIIQCLRGFYYTARTGSMTAASASMNRSQSTLSHQIKTLEQELGVNLFHGSKNQRVLTDEGKYLLKQVAELARLLNDMHLRTGSENPDVEGELSIVTISGEPLSLISEPLMRFCAAYPRVLLRHHCESEEDSLLRRVEAGSVDFGFMDGGIIPHALKSIPLFTSPFVLVTPLEGPHALSEPPSPERLCELPILASPLRSKLWSTVVRQLRRCGCNIPYTHIIDDRSMLMQCVASGLGVTILDEASCTGPLLSRLRLLPLSAFIPPRRYQLIWRSNLHLHPHLKAFLAWFMDLHFQQERMSHVSPRVSLPDMLS